MRVCIVLSARPGALPSGGVEKSTELLCRGLLQAGHDVTLVAAGLESDPCWAGVPTVRVAHSGRRMLAGGAADWNAAVGRVLHERRPQVAVGQGLGYAGRAVARWSGGARIVVAHGSFRDDLRHAYAWPGRAVRVPLVRLHGAAIVRSVDAVVNVTRDWRVNCPVAPRRQVHIPNPVDDEFYGREVAPVPGRVAFFGGPKRIKGLDLLLAAWPQVMRRLPHASLDLYGCLGGEPTNLPPACTALPALASSKDTAAAMARAQAVVLPSRFEVSPLVAAEAMALGVPIVATDVGGVRTMAEGVAGLCEPESDAIAATLLSALCEPGAWTARVQEGLRRSVSYRTDEVAAAYARLFDELI